MMPHDKWLKIINSTSYDYLHKGEIIHLDNIMQAGVYDLIPLDAYELCDENGENESDPNGDHIKMLMDVKYKVAVYVRNNIPQVKEQEGE